MAWERGYYYRVRKQGGQVVREYIGSGRVAELAAELDMLERDNRALEREKLREEKACYEAIEDKIKALIHLTDMAVVATLQEAGFHQHKGQWRKRRHGSSNSADKSDGN